MLNNKKCILVYNLNDEELQKLKRLPFKVIEITKEMTSMTVKNIIGGILAMVTPISINWTVNYLVNHLVLERETMSKGRR